MARAAPSAWVGTRVSVRECAPCVTSIIKNVSDNSKNKTSYGGATLSAGCGSATQVAVLIWGLRQVRFIPLGLQEILGYLWNVLKGLRPNLFDLEKKAAGCPIPASGFSPWLCRASERAASPDTAC